MPPRGPAPRPNGIVHLARPKTSPGFGPGSRRGNSIQAAITFEDQAIPEEDEEEEHIELLEYEWPDLPPIPSMKDAVSRKRVSQGISYLLPVDKGRNSINNRFRTDLRAMFQEPYASDDLQYDDNRVKLSAAVHFLSNTADTKWTPQHLNSIEAKLNADSENVRKLYVHSAPTGGVASRRMGIDPNKLRKRSNLFLPVKASKAQVSPEIVKLREEAAQIIKQGLSYTDEDDPMLRGNDGQDSKNNILTADTHLPNVHDSNKNSDSTITTNNMNSNNNKNNNNVKNNNNNNNNNNINNNSGNQADSGNGHSPNGTSTSNREEDQTKTLRGDNNAMLTTFGGSHLQDSLGTSVLNAKLQSVKIQQEKFNDYEELKRAVPPKPTIPKEFSSPYLTDEENQRIWEWLHFGEVLTDFEFFLSVCG